MNSPDTLQFTVYGVPQPQGSMRAFMRKGMKFPVVTSANAKLKPWRQEVTQIAVNAVNESGFVPLMDKQPIFVDVRFYFDRPKSTKKTVVFKVTKPDGDKLLRGIHDALTGVVFHDDSQVVGGNWSKQFGSPARTEVLVRTVSEN